MPICTQSKFITGDHKVACKWPQFDRDDEEAVIRVIKDGDVSTNPIIHELENAYCKYTGAQFALAHNNGTSALLAAFFSLGLQPRDEVLVPSATFWASIVPMTWLGVVPVFCESEEERLGIDPRDMEKKITSKTKAIVVVHLWGLPAKMTEIRKIAQKYNLKVIEDASHAHGASWRGEKCGILGDVGVFSLQGDKLAPAGEGGVLLTNDQAIYEQAICLGDITRIIQLNSPVRRFAVTSFGVKTRIAPMSAALGLSQLKKLDQHNKIRNDNMERLSQRLEILGINTYLADAHIERVYFEFLISWKEAPIPLTRIIEIILEQGGQAAVPRYPLLHQQPLFVENNLENILRIEGWKSTYSSVNLPKTEAINQNLIKIPCFTQKNTQLVEQYAQVFEKIASGDLL